MSSETYGDEETYRCRLGFRHLKSTRSTGEVALTEDWPDSVPGPILGTVGACVSFLNQRLDTLGHFGMRLHPTSSET